MKAKTNRGELGSAGQPPIQRYRTEVADRKQGLDDLKAAHDVRSVVQSKLRRK